MRVCLVVAAGLFLLVAAFPVPAQTPAAEYQVEIDKVHSTVREREGQRERQVTVQFRLRRSGSDELATDVNDDLVVYEDGRRVAGLKIHRPQANVMTTVLALDVSRSMSEGDKMEQARKAAHFFLDRLQERSDCGLLLFNDAILQPTLPPVSDPQLFAEQRQRMRQRIDAAKPRGGTAYLDATVAAVQMLEGVPGRKAILVMTDGVDLNSRKDNTLDEVINRAREAEIAVYTLGVGDPGKNDPVTSVLVLDRSNSMQQPTGGGKTKIKAAQEAAHRFVDIMRPGARASFTAFADVIDPVKPFTADKNELKARIDAVKLHGKTRFFDGTHEGLVALTRENAEGKRAVIVLTDGNDTTGAAGLKRMEESIQLARKHRIPIYPMAFGTGKVNEAAMNRLAKETGGRFYRPKDPKELIEIYENLSIQLHDDGIDEVSLTRLADETGGRYYHARNVEDLRLRYQEFAEELRSTYTVSFASWRPENDGTASRVEIVVERNGAAVSNRASGSHARAGVVVAHMHPSVYLVLLVLLAGLLALPGGLRHFYLQRRPAGSTRSEPVE